MYDRDLVIEILEQILTASNHIERRFVEGRSCLNILKWIGKPPSVCAISSTIITLT